MKTQALKNRLFGSSLALFLTVACLSPMSLRSAEPEDGTMPKMKEQCQEMKDAKEKCPSPR